MHRSLPLLAALTLTACGGPEPADLEVELPAGQTQPIYGGAPATAPFYAATVGLVQRYSSSVSKDTFCSGTLVTPSVVVTAAHCLDVGRRKVQTASPSSLAVYIGEASLTDPAPTFYAVVEAVIHPGYNKNALLNDIGLLRLAGDVPATTAVPVPVLPASLGFTTADIGAVLNFAGFGITENGTSDVRLETDGTLGGLGCTVAGCYGTDDPATQISYSQYDAGPCFGDSGGPAFLDRAGTSYLAGVTSWGDSYCTQFGVSTRVDAYESWIAAFAGTGGGPSCVDDGICEDGCTDDPDCAPPSGGSCGDGVCGDGESCDGRSGTTACGDCPGKVSGKPSSRFCYVEGVCQGPGC